MSKVCRSQSDFMVVRCAYFKYTIHLYLKCCCYYLLPYREFKAHLDWIVHFFVLKNWEFHEKDPVSPLVTKVVHSSAPSSIVSSDPPRLCLPSLSSSPPCVTTALSFGFFISSVHTSPSAHSATFTFCGKLRPWTACLISRSTQGINLDT